MAFEEKLKKVPLLPGVYIMKSENGEVIYVGKSKALKNRLSQYFKKSGHTGKVGAMVANIADFEYIVTATETEALVLECNLIKKYSPHYNILLKDNKQYPYIKITAKEDFPKMEIARRDLKDGAKYFGPFTAGVARQTMDVIYKTFRLPDCKRVFPKDIGKERPCLNYHIGKCVAPCTGKISSEEYRGIIGEICDFLEGKAGDVIKRLRVQMGEASENLEFEKAADLRDKIGRIRELYEKQNITVSGGGDKDILAVKADNEIANIQIFNIRNGKMLGRNQIWVNLSLGEQPADVLESFIMQYYIESEFIPQTVLVNVLPSSHELIEDWLSKKQGVKITLRVPERGKYKDIMNMALLNASEAFKQRGEQKLKAAYEKREIIETFSREIGFEKPVGRIEAYDISNTSGKNSAGGMIVLENGEFKKSEYRLFKIKEVQGVDDYASTKEVISRRFKRSGEDKKFAKLPDVILADGGMGHVSAIKEAALALGFDIPVFGMVKDDRHRTQRLISSDGEIITLSQESFRFVTAIQNEVHRFAIGYHKKLRSDVLMRSELDNIEGIGPVKKRALLRAFGSVKAIEKATIPQLAAADGVNEELAKKIYKYFHD
ncbi:MAG: excinuclease ABC subunit UvrC [Clostridia bacterium]|nr:excinuclease ABC subunit UvrC [Clostridia bacterium]